MATDVKVNLDLSAKVTERETGIGVGSVASQLVHLINVSAEYANGTGSLQSDVVHSGSISIATATTLDVRGSLSSVLTGDAVSFVEITGIVLRNTSSTAGQYVTVGGGSNPVTSIWGASGDAVIVGPGGLFVLTSPIDGYATTAGTADILTLTPATGTIGVDYVIFGRSA